MKLKDDQGRPLIAIRARFWIISLIVFSAIVGAMASDKVGAIIHKVDLSKPDNCFEARKRGLTNITSDSIYYSKKLDRDGDGKACEGQ